MASLWKDEYRVGVDKIDEQHRQLFDKIERLLEIVQSGDQEANRRECRNIVDFLVEYTMFHFETEERFQVGRGYVSYARHKKIHEDFKNTVTAYKELLERDFSAKTLKSFIGTLIAWIVNHVCVCDRKILKNIPLRELESFDNTEGFIRNVARKLLTDMYGIPILEEKSCIYKGAVDGDVIIRILAAGSRRHLFLYGLSDGLAPILYNKVSGMNLTSLEGMDTLEESAFMEIGNIISAYAMSAIEGGSQSGTRFESSLYLREYGETDYNISNGVILEFITGLGKMDVLYCPIK